jgi:glycosyltransferase involved in cell wall biosynthesis
MHAHSHCYFVTNLAALKRRLGDIPLAITNHGLYSQNAPERLFSLYLKTLGRWTFNQADVVFCYTDVDKERVRELGVNSRIEVVPNGIDTERFTPVGPESELIDAEGPVVLFVGRFAEGKRPWLAVEAFVKVLEEYPDAELYLCGDGALREDLEAQVAELGVGESVTFLGHVPYEEMPKVYRSGDVLVLPSRAEGVPRTVLEAITSGTGVVVSNMEQVNSAFKRGLRTVSSINATGFSRGINHQLCNNTIKNSTTGSNSSEFRWKKTVKSTTAILERIQP